MACPDCVTQKAISVLPDDMTMMTDCQEREERKGIGHDGMTVEEGAGVELGFLSLSEWLSRAKELTGC